MRARALIFLTAAAQGFLLGWPVSSWAQHYEITDLGLLPGRRLTEAFAINARYQVVGLADAPAVAFRWDSGEMVDLGTLGGTSAVAFGINNRGEVVGGSTLPGNAAIRGFVWRDGLYRDVGTLGGANSIAYAINQRGLVLGLAETSAGGVRTFLWQERGGMVDLGPLSLGGDPEDTRPQALNNAGAIVGEAETHNGEQHAFLWQRGVMTDLGTLGGSWSVARDINDAGVVVGFATAADTLDYSAVRWTHGQVESLGTLGRWSQARAVNNRGDVVGAARALDGTTHAILWRDGVLISLNDLIPPESGWWLAYANDINDPGAIVGVGRIKGQVRAFLLTPIHTSAQPAP
ncbi:MAG: HAF repeat-containing protein [Phycisphaerae bacterium]